MCYINFDIFSFNHIFLIYLYRIHVIFSIVFLLCFNYFFYHIVSSIIKSTYIKRTLKKKSLSVVLVCYIILPVFALFISLFFPASSL